jgi:hypothetical protein
MVEGDKQPARPPGGPFGAGPPGGGGGMSFLEQIKAKKAGGGGKLVKLLDYETAFVVVFALTLLEA